MVTEADYQTAMKYDELRQPLLDALDFSGPGRLIGNLIYDKSAHSKFWMFINPPEANGILQKREFDVYVVHAFENIGSLGQFQNFLYHEFYHAYEFAYFPEISLWEKAPEFGIKDTVINETIDGMAAGDLLYKVFYNRREVRIYQRQIEKAIRDGLPESFISSLTSKMKKYRSDAVYCTNLLSREGII